ncbi:Chaperone protein dnaJ 13 [Acorus gramineus]|uniref:Chaperone protein dnaJ 13 n=1 Tax=Acorus gramineus TaxID=55184 RepID=A0AAV9BVW1_ACOGR|nr:Chaperone protein dnaJ 13 [Acorus gramineus]
MGGDVCDFKAKLVTETCSISTTFTSCPHRRRSPLKPAFVDWYLILRVDENAGTDVIRRRYRQLALQLHPDKNKHSKAEIAFKLVSEAYECLSDKTKRKAFNAERKTYFCKECNNKKFRSGIEKHHVSPRVSNSTPTEQVRPRRFSWAPREARDRLLEESQLIERLLRARMANRGESPATRGESPIFNPFDRSLYPDYPHKRSPLSERQPDVWGTRRGEASKSCSRRGKCGYPYHELRAEVQPGKSKTAVYGH